MSKLFFDHLVLREEIELELAGFTLTSEEKQELLDIIDQTLITRILNVILNHLPREKHEDFISRFSSAPNESSHLDYLKQHAHPQIEEEIKKHSAKVKQEILSEIKKSSRRR